MSNTIKRIQSETPPFFKRMRPWAFFISAMAASIAGVTAGIPGVPAWVSLVFAGIGTVAGTAAAFTYLPTTDSNLSEQ